MASSEPGNALAGLREQFAYPGKRRSQVGASRRGTQRVQFLFDGGRVKHRLAEHHARGIGEQHQGKAVALRSVSNDRKRGFPRAVQTSSLAMPQVHRIRSVNH